MNHAHWSQSTLEIAGFKDIRRVANASREPVLATVRELLPARSEREDGTGITCTLWDGLRSDDERCASKTIKKLATDAGKVGFFLDSFESPLFQATPPDRPWAHLLGESGDWDALLDFYVFPWSDPGWVFIKTHEEGFGPYLLPWKVLHTEKDQFEPAIAAISALLQTLNGALLPSDSIMSRANYEGYSVRALGPRCALTIGVDRVEHRLFAFATMRNENEPDASWESWSRSRFFGVTAEEVAEGTGCEGAFHPLLDPDDIIEVITRLRLAGQTICSLRRRLC